MLETFDYGAEDRGFESWLRQTATRKLYQLSDINGFFFEPGKDKAAKEDGWAPPLYAVPKIQ